LRAEGALLNIIHDFEHAEDGTEEEILQTSGDLSESTPSVTLKDSEVLGLLERKNFEN
jgi:hypothetical protein